MKYTMVFLGLLALLSCAGTALADDAPSTDSSSSPSPPDTTSTISVVVAFGDSITAGYPYLRTGNGCSCSTSSSCCAGYEAGVEALLQYTLPNAVVHNWGISGEVSGDGLKRISSVLQSSQPSHVLLMEGTNDLWWLDTNTVAYNLLSMVYWIQSAGAVPILATLTPDTRGGKPIAAMNQLIREMGSTYNIAICDQYEVVASSWDSLNYDKLHPNTNGYWAMSVGWYNTLMLDTDGTSGLSPW